jgi:hypothetical protein
MLQHRVVQAQLLTPGPHRHNGAYVLIKNKIAWPEMFVFFIELRRTKKKPPNFPVSTVQETNRKESASGCDI